MRRNALPLSNKALPDPISLAAINLFNEITKAIDDKEKSLDEEMQQRYQEIEDAQNALKDKNQLKCRIN